MLTAVEVKNFKSAENLKLDLGRVNVFIGENGSGKSTILEALSFSGAAVANQLNDTFLEVRGVRTTSPEFMRSRFSEDSYDQPINLILYKDGAKPGSTLSCEYTLNNDNKTYSQWEMSHNTSAIAPNGKVHKNVDAKFELTTFIQDVIEKENITLENMLKAFKSESEIESESEDFLYQMLESLNSDKGRAILERSRFIKEKVTEIFLDMEDFTIYSPQNEQLRDLVKESKLKPLGIYGEGLFKLLMVIYHEEPEAFLDIEKGLKLFGWYKSIQLPEEDLNSDLLFIQDKYVTSSFNLHSVNEGFLYVLFYMALIVSKDTPKIFAIDNIDAALNPKLCAKIMSYLSDLAKKYDKQIFLTTQNPAVLDGINLHDNEQKLFVVTRNKTGQTKAKQFTADKKPMDSEGKPLRLSEAMLRGYLGGLPKGF